MDYYMQDIPHSIIQVGVLIVSVMFHELAHGYTALHFGDTTAARAGRLSLNPIRHLDPIGSIGLPLILLIAGSPIVLGWAKPVPVDVRQMQGKFAPAWVALAGPLANLLLAVIIGLSIRFFGSQLSDGALYVLITFVVANIVLMIFNLVPIPPLDGSHVLRQFVGSHSAIVRHLERFSLVWLLVVLFFFGSLFSGVIGKLVLLLTGIPI